MNAEQFRDIFHVLHNIDQSDLEAAGVITKGARGGSDWNRFNNDIGTFVLKLRQENLEALFVLVRSKMTVLSFDAYDQGRRDVLNAILALNPKVAQKLHILSGGTEDTFENHAGKLPFDVVFWTTEVAALPVLRRLLKALVRTARRDWRLLPLGRERAQSGRAHGAAPRRS